MLAILTHRDDQMMAAAMTESAALPPAIPASATLR
jgi:hypothetical protein